MPGIYSSLETILKPLMHLGPLQNKIHLLYDQNFLQMLFRIQLQRFKLMFITHLTHWQWRSYFFQVYHKIHKYYICCNNTWCSCILNNTNFHKLSKKIENSTASGSKTWQKKTKIQHLKIAYQNLHPIKN